MSVRYLQETIEFDFSMYRIKRKVISQKNELSHFIGCSESKKSRGDLHSSLQRSLRVWRQLLYSRLSYIAIDVVGKFDCLKLKRYENLRYRWLRDKCKRGEIRVTYPPIFTKPLGETAFDSSGVCWELKSIWKSSISYYCCFDKIWIIKFIT
jgi:hypothetical protein